jgi:RNA polymerase sigma factor (sigma-70 family)
VEGRPLEDAELIERAGRGDVEAYAELVGRYQELAFRTAYLVTRDSDEAADAAQQAFIKAHGALRRFRAGAAFRPWLLRIVANEARNRRRSAGRRGGLALRAAQSRPSADAAPSAEETVLVTEARETLLAAIDRLRDDDREVIVCRYFLDLAESETAEMLGIRRGTVKSRLSRALARLRLELGARIDD